MVSPGYRRAVCAGSADAVSVPARPTITSTVPWSWRPAPRSSRASAAAARARRRRRRTRRPRRRAAREIATRDPPGRATADRLLDELTDDRVERDLRRLPSSVGVAVSTSNRCRASSLVWSARARTAGDEALVAKHDRLEHERQVAELADRRAVPRERRLDDLARLVELSRRRSSAARRRASARSRRAAAPGRRGGTARAAAARPARRRSAGRGRRRRATWALVDDRFAQRDRDGLRAGVGLELGQDVADVALDGLLRDEELAPRRRRSRARRRAAGGSRARGASACRSGRGRRGTAASAPGRRSPRRRRPSRSRGRACCAAPP